MAGAIGASLGGCIALTPGPGAVRVCVVGFDPAAAVSVALEPETPQPETPQPEAPRPDRAAAPPGPIPAEDGPAGRCADFEAVEPGEWTAVITPAGADPVRSAPFVVEADRRAALEVAHAADPPPDEPPDAPRALTVIGAPPADSAVTEHWLEVPLRAGRAVAVADRWPLDGDLTSALGGPAATGAFSAAEGLIGAPDSAVSSDGAALSLPLDRLAEARATSVMVWLRPEGWPAAWADGAPLLSWPDGGPALTVGAEGALALAGAPLEGQLTADRWHHLAVTVDGDGRGTLWLDARPLLHADPPPWPARADALTLGGPGLQTRWDEAAALARPLDGPELAALVASRAELAADPLDPDWPRTRLGAACEDTCAEGWACLAGRCAPDRAAPRAMAAYVADAPTPAATVGARPFAVADACPSGDCPDPIGWWPLAGDLSARRGPALAGAPSGAAPGPYGRARGAVEVGPGTALGATLDGGGDAVTVWLRPDSDGAALALGPRLRVRVLDGQPALSVDGGQSWSSTGRAIIDGDWHHLAVTWGWSTALFVDGVESALAPPLDELPSPATLTLGADPAGDAAGMSGAMAELIVHPAAPPASALLRRVGVPRARVVVERCPGPAPCAPGHWPSVRLVPDAPSLATPRRAGLDAGQAPAACPDPLDLCAGLLGWWPLDRLHPYAPDVSGRTNQAFAFESAIRPGPWGVARALERPEQALLIDPLPLAGLTTLTLEAWVAPADPGGVLLAAEAAPGLRWQVDGLTLPVDGACPPVESEAPAPDGWQHLAATWDGATLTLWRDGVVIGEGPCAGALDPGEGDWRMGPAAGDPPTGDLADLRVSAFAREPAAFRGPPVALEVGPRSAGSP